MAMAGRVYRVAAVLVVLTSAACSSSTRNSRQVVVPTTTSSGHTTTTIALVGQSYQVGDCVTWDQSKEARAKRDTTTVPCTEPHLLEITGSHVVPGLFRPYPSDAAWREIGNENCDELASAYLATTLDPNGRFDSGWLTPLPDTWARGDHRLWCGLTAKLFPQDDAGQSEQVPLLPLTESAKGKDQAFLYGTGACLVIGTDGLIGAPVPCPSAHDFEVTGSINLRGRASDVPATTDAWDQLIGDDCERLVTSYLGRSPSDPNVRSGYLGIPPESWAAGRRVVECMVGVYDAQGKSVPGVGPIRERTR
jgi:hypothetical protein